MSCGVVSIPLPGLPLGVAHGGTAPAGFRARFLAGPENQLVEPAVAAVLDQAVVKYNPLLLWGPSGTGKTHVARGLAEACAPGTAAGDASSMSRPATSPAN